jgi:signal transduction histidine kinase
VLKYVGRVNRVAVLARRYGFDVLIVITAVASALEAALRQDSPRAPETALWFAVPANAIIVLPLLVRRRFPFAAPLSVWLLAAAISFLDGRLVSSSAAVFITGMAAAFLLGNLGDARQTRIGLVVVLVGAAIIVYNDPTRGPGDFIFTPVFFGIGWLAGFAMRQRSEQAQAAEVRAAQAERERDAAMRIAVAEERARIARELHDIVAHAVSVMVLHVGAVRHKLPHTLAEERDALDGVEQTGRAALAEMRRLLGAMRHDGQDLALTPQPGLDSLESLLAEVGHAGLAVKLHVDGDPLSLPRAIDLSAYRIIQEGLTNALKHAQASHADVTVRYGSDELQIEIRDDGRGIASTDGLGYGLVGIRERVKIYGGEMTTKAAPGGGFVLSTRLPFAGERP